MQFRLALCFSAIVVQVDCMVITILQLLESFCQVCLDSIKRIILGEKSVNTQLCNTVLPDYLKRCCR